MNLNSLEYRSIIPAAEGTKTFLKTIPRPWFLVGRQCPWQNLKVQLDTTLEELGIEPIFGYPHCFQWLCG